MAWLLDSVLYSLAEHETNKSIYENWKKLTFD
jgi:hypothetical protein